MKVIKARQSLITSIIAIVLSFSLLIGSTYAWFTDTSTSGINKIQSGNLDVGLFYTNSYTGTEETVTENTPIFMDINGDPILWEPGASASGRFEVANDGSLSLKYNLSIITANATATPDGKTLEDALSVYVLTRLKDTGTDDVMQDPSLESLQIDSAVPSYDPMNMPALKDGLSLEAYLLPGESITYEIGLCWLPSANDNDFNVAGGLSIDFAVSLIATQVTFEKDGDGGFYDSNAQFPDPFAFPDVWDGSNDVAWYNETDTTFKLSSAESVAGLAQLVDEGNTFEGKTIILDADVDLSGQPFNPIGTVSSKVNNPFKGTFDGNGHTISNLAHSGWDFGYEWGVYGSIGLFGGLDGATIKNVTIDGFDAQIEGGDIGGITGSAEGNCTFENITIQDSTFGTYNNGIGGIIGWSGEGTFVFKNVTIAEDVVLGGLWGSFDSSVGGVVGQATPGSTYVFENVNVACRLDIYNDVTASYQYYQYRMSGMLIGRCEETITIDGRNYPDTSKYDITCSNVTVTYGEWANYHYCLGFNGSRYTRVESGYAYGGLDITAEDHSDKCTDHLLCLPFDGLIGGDQYGVSPLTTFNGVTVVYNNK